MTIQLTTRPNLLQYVPTDQVGTYCQAKPTGLADLRALKTRWVTDARQAGTFDALLTIGRELGVPYEARHAGQYKLWTCQADIPVTPIIISYSQVTGRLVRGGGWDNRTNTNTAEFEQIERISVYLGPANFDPGRRDPAGHPYLANALLACRYHCSTHPTGQETAHIVPGLWLNAAVEYLPAAEEHALTSILDAQDRERQRLQAALLIGIEI